MKRPRIGVTLDSGLTSGSFPLPRHELKQAYSQAVLAAGGLPLLLPASNEAEVVDAYLETCQGLLVTGGAFDIPPEMYGEAPRAGLGELRPERTAFEQLLMRAALARGMPILGICGGMQLLNVVMGGSLHQDIVLEIAGARSHEQQTDRREPSHAVEITPGTRLAQAMGAGTVFVNSTHHQAVRQLGRDLVTSALAPDGVIEGIESTRHRFVVGVQWHPELLIGGGPAHLELYRAFAAAAAEGAESKGR